MRTAIRVMSIGWGVLGLLTVAEGVLRVLLPRRDDLGVGILVVSTSVAGLGVAASVMLVGAGMGVYGLVTSPAQRTSTGVAATGGTVLALIGLAYFAKTAQ